MIEHSKAGRALSGIDNAGISRFGRQRGMSLIGLFIAALAIFFAAILVMKIVPMYLTDQKISSIFKQLKDFTGSPREIRDTIDKQLDINEIDNQYHAKDFKITPAGNGYRVVFNYQAKAGIVGNLSVVADFKHQVHVSGR